MSQLVATCARHKALRETSVGVYKRRLKRFEDFMGRDPRVGEITRAELQDYRDDLQAPKDENKRPLQVTSVKQYMAPVAAILAFAFDEGMIETNPAAGLKMPVGLHGRNAPLVHVYAERSTRQHGLKASLRRFGRRVAANSKPSLLDG
ncbi:MAG: phage integrase SAM-like domain-containing protein [Thalassovita sp.]